MLAASLSVVLLLANSSTAPANGRVDVPTPREALPDFSFDQPVRDAPAGDLQVDLVRVRKGARRLELFARGAIVSDYRISLGSEPQGHKRRQGDGRTPEGRYEIDWRKSDSDYHLALHVSYPNAEDARQARALGESPGGAIMIHGLPNGRGLIGKAHLLADWTDGCIAVTNREIEEIWEQVRDGTPIEILP